MTATLDKASRRGRRSSGGKPRRTSKSSPSAHRGDEPLDTIALPTDDLARRQGCVFCEEAARRAEQFFPRFLRLTQGKFAGQPFTLEQWQRRIVRTIFGWVRPDGTRRFRKGYISTAKKQGKSTLAAGIGLFLMSVDGESRAEVYIAAGDRNQAGIIHREAANMVLASAPLVQRCKVIDSTKRIVFEPTAGLMAALSAEAGTKEGLNIHGLLFDELHTQPSDALWNTLKYAGAARSQPLFLSFTTAGYDRDSLCWREYSYAKGVLAGAIEDPAYFVFIAEMGEQDDWNNEENWYKANPNLGVTVSVEDMRQEYGRAKLDPSEENIFRRYRLNQWVAQVSRWLPLERWDACAGPMPWGQMRESMRGRDVLLGCDLSSSGDISALLAITLPRPGVADDPILICPTLFMPSDVIDERQRVSGQPLASWAAQGAIVRVPQPIVDTTWHEREIERWGQEAKVRCFAFDPWNAVDLVNRLTARGVPLLQVRQGFGSMNAPLKRLEELILTGRIQHGNHPVLRWMFDNMAVEMDAAGNKKPSKKQAAEKIDGIVALIDAVAAMMVQPEAKQSVYETRGVLAF